MPLLPLVLVLATAAQALYFDCFSDKRSQAECETSEYCVWTASVTGARMECALSAQSLYLLCVEEANGAAAGCEAVSSPSCPLTTNEPHCAAQPMCAWENQACVVGPVLITTPEDTAKEADSKCCAESWKVCSRTSLFYSRNRTNRGKMAQQELTAKQACGNPETKLELCGEARNQRHCTAHRTAD